MNFNKQLKIYRERDGYSQEELAEKIYVTRQTISKWENDHTYPDIHNLIALSTLFDVTLDELVKGDVEIMKNTQDIEAERMNRLSWVMLLFIVLAVLSIGPALLLWDWYGLSIPLVLWAISMVAALKIEKIKKEKDVQTYSEIVAFMDGNDLETARAKRDKKRDRWNKAKIVVGFSLVAGILATISSFLWVWLS
ncbi:hypothetical protein IGJ55_000324 [Enterococcus sp. AZ170]|uniref:helix-turn-helix transcriptional regulator n=1 Tax=Enterococcus sp. AZ170 TaxID=2774747 RepID=UPI003D2FEE27